MMLSPDVERRIEGIRARSVSPTASSASAAAAAAISAEKESAVDVAKGATASSTAAAAAKMQSVDEWAAQQAVDTLKKQQQQQDRSRAASKRKATAIPANKRDESLKKLKANPTKQEVYEYNCQFLIRAGCPQEKVDALKGKTLEESLDRQNAFIARFVQIETGGRAVRSQSK